MVLAFTYKNFTYLAQKNVLKKYQIMKHTCFVINICIYIIFNVYIIIYWFIKFIIHSCVCMCVMCIVRKILDKFEMFSFNRIFFFGLLFYCKKKSIPTNICQKNVYQLNLQNIFYCFSRNKMLHFIIIIFLNKNCIFQSQILR